MANLRLVPPANDNPMALCHVEFEPSGPVILKQHTNVGWQKNSSLTSNPFLLLSFWYHEQSYPISGWTIYLLDFLPPSWLIWNHSLKQFQCFSILWQKYIEISDNCYPSIIILKLSLSILIRCIGYTLFPVAPNKR